jgi:hypothetical protein
MLTPVVLPPGRVSEFTSPDPTISSVVPKIGIVRPLCRANSNIPDGINEIDMDFDNLRRKF